ncbi:MAG TPA: tRNA epoxyqueuosine(34) reductase QueG [Cytophagaceae bacterium]
MLFQDKTSKTTFLKSEVKALGFDYCGISEASFLEEEAPRLEKWLKGNMHGKMNYMENHFDKRLDPRKLVDGAKSVVSMLLNYYPEKDLFQSEDSVIKVSKYAYGNDYHEVIKSKLYHLLSKLRTAWGEINGRAFVDSAPVLDKAWAKKSGLGWVGKNSNLINKQSGSFFFIAELIIDVELEYDGPIKDYCGTCTRCVDACPTDAIVDPYIVDGSKCISYLTIELKDQIPESFSGKMDNWIFGCDICQDVCPWNRFSKTHTEENFKPLIEEMSQEDWKDITEDVFRTVLKNSAIKRTKYNGLRRNIDFLTKP